MIRITKKCDHCGDIMFWKADEWHCKLCKVKVWEPFHLLLNEITVTALADAFSVPEGMDT